MSAVRFAEGWSRDPFWWDEAPRALGALVEAGVLAAGAEVVLERSRRHPFGGVEGLVVLDERRYGETLVTRLGAVQAVRANGGGGST